jgi:FixJ family two-component response regulator
MSSPVKERVLLVDDEPQVLVALEDLLCDDFVVFKADSAQSALNLVEREREIAVVVTDHRMPKMSGADLLVRLGDTSSAVRIMVTGFAELSSVVRAINDGKLFAYVTKPWDANDLRLKVEKAAQQFRLAKQLGRQRELLDLAEQRLSEQAALLNAILAGVGDGVVAVDQTGRFTLFNGQAEKIVGFAPGAITLDDWATTCGLYLPDQTTPLSHAEDPLVRALGGMDIAELELIVRNSVVAGPAVTVTAMPLRDDANVCVGAIALLRVSDPSEPAPGDQ